MNIVLAVPLKDLTEKEWERQAIGLAKTLGWHCYHTLRSKGSQPGYPDWTLVRDRVVFLELKREDGRLTDAQRVWLKALALVEGIEAYCWWPSDWAEIERILE